MIISGGVNIYPAEIEAEILKLPGVADSAVFGIPDDEFGEAICAVIQPPPATRCRARSSSATPCRAKIPARSSSASCASRIGKTPAVRSSGRHPPQYVIPGEGPRSGPQTRDPYVDGPLAARLDVAVIGSFTSICPAC